MDIENKSKIELIKELRKLRKIARLENEPIIAGRKSIDRQSASAALHKAKLEAEKANLAKSEFLANMSHEIRSPIQTIIGMAELLADTELTIQQREYVDIFRNAGNNLLELISDILDISKIEKGDYGFSESEFSLRELLHGIMRTFSFRTEKKQLQFACNISEDTPDLYRGNSTHIIQVIANLIGNAVKFTDKGHITIDIKPIQSGKEYQLIQPIRKKEFPKSSQKIRLEFIVSDSGIGIPESKLEAVFESFLQVDSSNTKKYAGTGLGLAISKKIVEKMGGDIRAESKLGEGATFTFSIPLQVLPSDYKLPALNKEALLEDRRKTRILLVEDSEDILFLLEAFIKLFSYSLVTAENGAEGVQKFKSGKFEIVFMDIQMPVMDGYSACREIRKWEEEMNVDGTPIIALTAHAVSSYEEKSLDAGFTAHVSKPIKKNDFLQTIYTYAKRRKN